MTHSSKIKGLSALFLLVTFSLFSQDPGKAKFIDPGNMNLLVKPGDDFVEYSGGVWLKKNSIPAKETTWGSFTILRDFNVKALKNILAEASADTKAKPGSAKRRVADFYEAALDSATVEKLNWFCTKRANREAPRHGTSGSVLKSRAKSLRKKSTTIPP